jgi:hypothetical protein
VLFAPSRSTINHRPLPLPYASEMEQIMTSLAPRATPKSNVTNNSQQAAGSVTKRYALFALSQQTPLSQRVRRLGNELMTLMVCIHQVHETLADIESPSLVQMSTSPGIVSGPTAAVEPPSTDKATQSAFPKTDGNLFEWAGTIEGAPGTVCHCMTSTFFPLIRTPDLCGFDLQDFYLLPTQLSLRCPNYQV